MSCLTHEFSAIVYKAYSGITEYPMLAASSALIGIPLVIDYKALPKLVSSSLYLAACKFIYGLDVPQETAVALLFMYAGAIVTLTSVFSHLKSLSSLLISLVFKRSSSEQIPLQYNVKSMPTEDGDNGVITESIAPNAGLETESNTDNIVAASFADTHRSSRDELHTAMLQFVEAEEPTMGEFLRMFERIAGVDVIYDFLNSKDVYKYNERLHISK